MSKRYLAKFAITDNEKLGIFIDQHEDHGCRFARWLMGCDVYCISCPLKVCIYSPHREKAMARGWVPKNKREEWRRVLPQNAKPLPPV